MALKDLASLASKSDEAAPKQVVIIIDDDEAIIRSLKTVLSKKFEVRGFTNPVEGVEAAVRPDVAVAIIDIKMPMYDGFWVYRRIRESESDVPIIFNSAYQDVKPPAEIAAHYRPYAYLQKNGNLNDFLQTVAGAAGTRVSGPAERAAR
jgi:DNA-binding NtrC family response regulator